MGITILNVGKCNISNKCRLCLSVIIHCYCYYIIIIIIIAIIIIIGVCYLWGEKYKFKEQIIK